MSSISSRIWEIRCWVPSESVRPGRVTSAASASMRFAMRARPKLLLAALDGHVHVGADGVGQGAHGGTLLGRDLAHGVHDGGQAALAAQDANAQGLQGVHVLGLGKALLDLSLNCLEVVGHRHCVLPFPNKNPSSGILCPRTDDFRGTTLVDERVFSRARPLLGPVPWGGRLPYWVARSAPAPAATVKVAAGGVNSGRQPWRDLSAGEPHLPVRWRRDDQTSPSLPSGTW